MVDSDSSAPERSPMQRLDALERANLVRTRRAQLKKDLKGGRESIHALLEHPPDYVKTAKVMDMLLAVPKYGRVKAHKVLSQCRVTPSKTIGGLSERQRAELLALLSRDPSEDPRAPRRATFDAPAQVGNERAERADRADTELTSGLERLLEEARQVGRLASRAARDAGVKLDASAPRPDTVGLQEALSATLRERRNRHAPVPTGAIVAGEPSHSSPAVAPAPAEGDDALRHANELRLARMELKRKVGDGTIAASDVIRMCPWQAAGLTIAELLLSQRRWGTTRCSQFLARVGIPEAQTIGSLTERQRSLLLSALP